MGHRVLDHVHKHSQAVGPARHLLLELACMASNETWDCWPAVETLAQRLDCNKRTVTRLSHQLESTGELRVVPNGGPTPLTGLNAGRTDRRTNLYVLSNGETPAGRSRAERGDKWSNGVTPETPRRAERGDICDAQRGDICDTNGVTPETPESVTRNQSLESVTKRRARATGSRAKRAVELAGFAAFWDAYPRHVARARAEASYAKAVGNGATPDSIASGLSAWVSYWTAEGTDERFIPHPTTWLNQERYGDAPPAAAPSGASGRTSAAQRSQEVLRRRIGGQP
jgi:hypothetical protein